MAEGKQEYCRFCGCRLEKRYHPEEKKEVPYCPVCGDYRFPVFHSAVVMAILDESKERMLMVRQFGDDRFYFVAGYIDQGETAEHAVVRETMEETGLSVSSLTYNASHYYAPSNTLMLFYTVTVRDGTVTPNEEVDDYGWFPVDEVCSTLPKHDLAAELIPYFK